MQIYYSLAHSLAHKTFSLKQNFTELIAVAYSLKFSLKFSIIRYCQDEINHIQLISEQRKTVFRGPLYFVDSFLSLLRQKTNVDFSFSPGREALSRNKKAHPL